MKNKQFTPKKHQLRAAVKNHQHYPLLGAKDRNAQQCRPRGRVLGHSASQSTLNHQLATLSDSQFRLLHAAVVSHGQQHRSIPIAFPDQDPEYLDETQLAHRLQISTRSLQRRMKEGSIPFLKVRGRVIFIWKHITESIDILCPVLCCRPTFRRQPAKVYQSRLSETSGNRSS
jgi:hypothetical protein